MAGEALDANAAQRRYWNTVAGPRWVASPGFRERRNQESLALLLAHLGLTGAGPCSRTEPAGLRRPRLYPRGPGGGRVRGDCGREGSPDDHRRQPRGGSPPGADDGTDGQADRGEAARRGNPPNNRPRDRGRL